MSQRPVFPAILFLLSAVVLGPPALGEELVIDLATAGETETRTVARDAEYQIKLENMMPATRYSVSIRLASENIDPLAVDSFTVGGEGLPPAAEPEETPQGADLPLPDCTPTLRDLITQLRAAADESEVRDVAVLATQTAGQCKTEIEATIQELTQRWIAGTTPAPGREHKVEIKVVGTGSPAKEWVLILTHASEGEWRVSYGITFVNNQDKRYFTEVVPDQAGKFQIVKQADREKADFIPSIFFSWHGNRRRLGPAFGLGYDLESPSLFLGLGWKYRQNVMITGGLALHGRQDLKGRYDPNDVIGENLGEDQLTEPSFVPNIYLGAGFRFGSNVHQQRAAALRKLETERQKAAAKAKEAAAAAKKEEDKKKAELELCEKRAETTLADATAVCGEKPADEIAPCIGLATAQAAEQKAECKLEAAGGQPEQEAQEERDNG